MEVRGALLLIFLALVPTFRAQLEHEKFWTRFSQPTIRCSISQCAQRTSNDGNQLFHAFRSRDDEPRCKTTDLYRGIHTTVIAIGPSLATESNVCGEWRSVRRNGIPG